MKEWAEDHPKAKAMRRKRQAILTAGRTAFLRTGYSATSMDAIAQIAGISLMTLYRHAESKDELFAAVVTGACSAEDEAEQRYLLKLMDMDLPDVLRLSAIHMQSKLTHPDTIALMRLVIAEAASFPHLLALAHDGFVGHFERVALQIIEQKWNGQDPQRAVAASRVFVERVVGSDVLRILLGQPAPSEVEQEIRGIQARDDTLQALGVSTE